MDKLHARVRAFQSPPTERNLAKQPDPEFDDADYGQRQGEANVVEMPKRQTQEAFASNASEPSPTQRSIAMRKQGAATKRKAAATSQQAFPFRQMRDGHQQPYIDELKRLEAQAERINQLLADRKRKQAGAEQSVAQTNGEPIAGVEKASPKKKAPKSARQPSRSPQREVPPMPVHDDDTKALEAQAERIKQLLQELEAALVEGEALPNGTERKDDYRVAEDHVQTAAPPSPSFAPDAESFASSTYRYGADAVTFAVNQAHVVTGATDQKAQQEATETAQALRYLASREQVEPATAATSQPESRRHPGRSHDRRTNASSKRHYGLRLRQFLQIPQTSLDRVGDAVLWIILAAALRVGARLLLGQFPVLAPLLLVLMFAPAAFAVYLAMYVPKAGFVSIYRLFLMMLGLLLGGRL